MKLASTGFLPAKNATYTRLRENQCQARRTVLAREAKYGTPVAARMSSNTGGDGTLGPLNSSFVPNIRTPVGELDVDWYTDLVGYGAGFQMIVYPVAKLTWTAARLWQRLPIGHAFPWADVGERNAYIQSQPGGIGSTDKEIFTPDCMRQACPN
jgi:hypothetical protein